MRCPGRTVPGIWSEPSALHGADAVLITHEHTDHIDVLRLAGLGAESRLGRPVQATIREPNWLESGTGAFHDTLTSRPMVRVALPPG